MWPLSTKPLLVSAWHFVPCLMEWWWADPAARGGSGSRGTLPSQWMASHTKFMDSEKLEELLYELGRMDEAEGFLLQLMWASGLPAIGWWEDGQWLSWPSQELLQRHANFSYACHPQVEETGVLIDFERSGGAHQLLDWRCLEDSIVFNWCSWIVRFCIPWGT